MQRLRRRNVITAFLGITLVSHAQTNRPNLQGVWQLWREPQRVIANFNITQSGDRLTMQYLPEGKPDVLTFEGAFISGSSITGKAIDPKAKTPEWVPRTISINDADHLEFDNGQILTRAQRESGAYMIRVRQMTVTKLPTKPFDLNGNWAMGNRNFSLTQQNGEIALARPDKTVIVRGKYVSNPDIAGEILTPGKAPGAPATWAETKIVVLSPDHFAVGRQLFSRTSNPGDIACDAQNSSHVDGVYAWRRGAAAMSAKDYKTAGCWLEIGADLQTLEAQGALAALIIQGGEGAADYGRAFSLAYQSAQGGDPGGAIVLAGMYQNGLGTQADPEQAKMWLKTAKQSERAQKMLAAMTPEMLMNNFSQALGMVGSFVETDNMMGLPPNCFSHDVLGNKGRCQ